MRDLTLQESRDYTYEGRCRLWGQDVFVGLDLPEGEDKARALEAALPAVEIGRASCRERVSVQV